MTRLVTVSGKQAVDTRSVAAHAAAGMSVNSRLTRIWCLHLIVANLSFERSVQSSAETPSRIQKAYTVANGTQ